MKTGLGAGLLGVATFLFAVDVSTYPAAAQVPTGQIISTVTGQMQDQLRLSLHNEIYPRQKEAILRAVEQPQAGTQNWQAEEQQAMGTVTPLRSFSRAGKQCAEVKQTLSENGKLVSESTSSYCKESDGSLSLLD